MSDPGNHSSRASALWSAIFWAGLGFAAVESAVWCRSNVDERIGQIRIADIPTTVPAPSGDTESERDRLLRSLPDQRIPGSALGRNSVSHFALAFVFASLFILNSAGLRPGFVWNGRTVVVTRLCAGAAGAWALHWPRYVSEISQRPDYPWSELDPRYLLVPGELLIVVLAAHLLGSWRTAERPGTDSLSDVSFVGAYMATKAAWMSGYYLNGIETACPYVTCFSARPGALAAIVLICVACVRFARTRARVPVAARMAMVPAFAISWACGAAIQFSWIKSFDYWEKWRLPGEILAAVVCLGLALVRIRRARAGSAAGQEAFAVIAPAIDGS